MNKIHRSILLACLLGMVCHTTSTNFISLVEEVTGYDPQQTHGYAALALALTMINWGLYKEKRLVTVIGSMVLVPTLLVNYSYQPQGTILFGLTGMTMIVVGVLVNEALKGNLSWTSINKLLDAPLYHAKATTTNTIN